MNTETLILTGEGYNLTITTDAEDKKAQILDRSKAITTVRSNDDSGEASYHMRALAQMRIAVEKSRKEIKEPVQRIGKLIDATAKTFLLEIEDEEARIRGLIGDYATEVARMAEVKAEEERKAFEIARAAREASNVAQDVAEATGKLSDVIAAKQAEHARTEALAARMDASSELAATKIADGIRFAWDFEVDDIGSVARMAPEFISMEIKRSAVLAWFRELEAADVDVAAAASLASIRAFKKPVVSSR